MVDNGVAGENGAGGAAVVGEGDGFEGGEAAYLPACVFEQEDVVFFGEVAAEEFGRGAAVVTLIEGVECGGLLCGQGLRGEGAGGEFVHGSLRVRRVSQ